MMRVAAVLLCLVVHETCHGLAAYALENAGRGNITQVDGVASIRNTCNGQFEGLTGPWVKGKNFLLVTSVALDPFKSVLSEGLRP